MSQQKRVHTNLEKITQVKNKSPIAAEKAEELPFQTGISGLINGPPLVSQASHLNDPRFLLAQRQRIADQVGQVAGNQFLQRKLTPPTQAEQPTESSNLLHYQSPEVHLLQLTPDAPPQSLAGDVAGWVGDLLRVIGWGTLAGGEQQGRSALHLLHNMLGSGEPVTVPKEWVMDSPQWRSSYETLLTRWTRQVVTNSATRDESGESTGNEHLSISTSSYSLPSGSCILPMCPGADQFFASGGAQLTVEGDYRWYVSNDLLPVLVVELYNIVGSYQDTYDWHHEADPGQYSRQERGWYTPFTISSSWPEPDRVERRLRAAGVPPGTFQAGPLQSIP